MKRALAGGVIAASLLTGSVVAGAVGLDDGDREDRIEELRQERSEQLRATLDPLVADGTIDQTQLEAVVGALESAADDRRAEREDRRAEHRAEREANIAAVADVIGIDVETLTDQLRSGSTLAEIAGDEVDAVIDLLVQQKTERIDEAVAEGKVDQARADEIVDSLEERVTDAVNGEGRGFGRHGGRFGPGPASN